MYIIFKCLILTGKCFTIVTTNILYYRASEPTANNITSSEVSSTTSSPHHKDHSSSTSKLIEVAREEVKVKETIFIPGCHG